MDQEDSLDKFFVAAQDTTKNNQWKSQEDKFQLPWGKNFWEMS